jgi:hypothetical protein
MVGSFTYWPDHLQEALTGGTLNPTSASGTLDGAKLNEVLRLYLDFKASAQTPGKVKLGKLFSEIPDFSNISKMRAVAAAGTHGPDTQALAHFDSLSTEAKAMGMLQWMLNKEKGVVKLSFGDWSLCPGNFKDLSDPWWLPMIPKFSETDLFKLEQLTRPCTPFSWGSLVDGKPPYSVDQLDAQVADRSRPAFKSIVNGFWAPSHLDGFHWERKVSTWDMPTMISSLGQKHTLKQIWDWWTTLPSVSKSKTKGSNLTRGDRSQSRLRDYLDVRERTDKLLKDAGVEPPTNIADYRAVIRKVGALLTARTILSRTPLVVMELPVQAGHDSKSAMRDRVVCDERITLSKEDFKGVPAVWDKLGYLTDKELLHVQMFYRCNTKI